MSNSCLKIKGYPVLYLSSLSILFTNFNYSPIFIQNFVFGLPSSFHKPSSSLWWTNTSLISFLVPHLHLLKQQNPLSIRLPPLNTRHCVLNSIFSSYQLDNSMPYLSAMWDSLKIIILNCYHRLILFSMMKGSLKIILLNCFHRLILLSMMKDSLKIIFLNCYHRLILLSMTWLT